jgi:DNA-binding NarL/FixJ family response regulator
MKRVLIVDGELSSRRHVRYVLERQHDMVVVGEASDALTAVSVMRQVQSDVVLIDFGLCRQLAPGGLVVGGAASRRTLVMVAATEAGAIIEAFRLGAHGVLLKTADPESWAESIRRVMDGQYCFGDGGVAVLLDAFRASFAAPKVFSGRDYRLTTRELGIVSGIVAGRSNREVGRQLSICERTVKHHLTCIFDKVGVSSRLELALFALKHGLSEPESCVRQSPAEWNVAVEERRAVAAAHAR